MNKGIFYMLTATEVQHLKDVITELMSVANPGEYNEEEAHQAVELLSKLKGADVEWAIAQSEMVDEEVDS